MNTKCHYSCKINRLATDDDGKVQFLLQNCAIWISPPLCTHVIYENSIIICLFIALLMFSFHKTHQIHLQLSMHSPWWREICIIFPFVCKFHVAKWQKKSLWGETFCQKTTTLSGRNWMIALEWQNLFTISINVCLKYH